MSLSYRNQSIDIKHITKLVGNRAKGRISKRVFQENKARQIFRKTNISYPLIRTQVRNVRFSENLTCFVFLKHPFWDSPFCLITDELVLRNWVINFPLKCHHRSLTVPQIQLWHFKQSLLQLDHSFLTCSPNASNDIILATVFKIRSPWH